ncbi:MAG: diacylglycerol kinase [Burkholderiales bacterium]
MHNKFLGTGDPGYHPLRKIRIVLSGLRFAVVYDFSVTYKLVLSMVIVAAAFWLRQWLDALLILFATGLVLIAEMFNSAIEALCDFVETRHNEKIRVIKDIAAAAVGISIALWVTIVVVEVVQLWPKLVNG